MTAITDHICYVCDVSGQTTAATIHGCEHLASQIVPSERARWAWLCDECHAAGPCPECNVAR
jgi:hypothetical protein